jgi:cytidylate kinase
MRKLVVTIDGPAGAGKTTVSRMLADRLGYKYIDTGALYRGVAHAVNLQSIDPEDDRSLEKLCAGLELNLVQSDRGLRLLSNGTDITDQIRTPQITMLASAVSARPVVRRFLLKLQRDLGKAKGAVFEGRDMGTVVFPEAEIKFFLDATPKTRAQRRYLELKSNKSQTRADVEKDMRKRDKNDRSRSLAPLKPADDATLIDSTILSADEVVELMLAHIQERCGDEK